VFHEIREYPFAREKMSRYKKQKPRVIEINLIYILFLYAYKKVESNKPIIIIAK